MSSIYTDIFMFLLQEDTSPIQIFYLDSALIAYFLQLIIYCAHGNELTYQVIWTLYSFIEHCVIVLNHPYIY